MNLVRINYKIRLQRVRLHEIKLYWNKLKFHKFSITGENTGDCEFLNPPPLTAPFLMSTEILLSYLILQAKTLLRDIPLMIALFLSLTYRERIGRRFLP